MAEQIYDKEDLRQRVVQHLLESGRHGTTNQVAQAVGAQFWAVEQALEEAFRARELTFSEGLGWLALDVPRASAAGGAG